MLKSESVRLKSGRHWQVYDGGSGPALLWLHGPRGVDAADPLLEALSARHRIVAPVAPGFNDLDELTEIDSVHELALDYDDLLRGLGLGPLAIVGHSFGGMVAAELAAHFPDRAQRLVLLASVGLWNDAYPVADVFAVPVGEMDRLLWHDMAARDAHAARIAASAAGQDQVEQLLALTRNLTSLTKILWPIPDRGLRRRLHRIAAPTLILFGASDAFVPARYGADFAAGIAGARSISIDGAGHMLPYEKTRDVAAAIEAFLSGKPA
ncbi:MAG TPA: alpha/beta hydrolase [Stellaceae bacterium]|nr:alpha/beta hydrolase [Stellaceae bacterium]